MHKFHRLIYLAIQILLTLMLLVYIFLETYEHSSDQKRQRLNYRLTKVEFDLIEDGDIVLRHGYGLVSDMIVNTLNESFSISHCAIVVKDDSSAHVIHSVSQSLSDYDGVQIQDLRPFINNSKKNSVIVIRFNKSEDRHLISERARYYLSKRVPFDSSFDIKDTSKFFCSELIWRIILDAFDVDIFESKYEKGHLELLKFDIFVDSNYFDLVFSHQDF